MSEHGCIESRGYSHNRRNRLQLLFVRDVFVPHFLLPTLRISEACFPIANYIPLFLKYATRFISKIAPLKNSGNNRKIKIQNTYFKNLVRLIR